MNERLEPSGKRPQTIGWTFTAPVGSPHACTLMTKTRLIENHQIAVLIARFGRYAHPSLPQPHVRFSSLTNLPPLPLCLSPFRRTIKPTNNAETPTRNPQNHSGSSRWLAMHRILQCGTLFFVSVGFGCAVAGNQMRGGRHFGDSHAVSASFSFLFSPALSVVPIFPEAGFADLVRLSGHLVACRECRPYYGSDVPLHQEPEGSHP